MQKYQDFDLSDTIKKSLAKMKYVEATPIQAQAIPLALQGHDIMGSAQTGTGKTAAYSIPLVEHLLNNPGSTGLVLTPTRELGKQIIDIIHQLLGPKSKIKTAFIIGGEPMPKQLKQLQANPRLIVGTPGRINDHLQRGTMQLSNADFLVLDETDRMLDMGFTIQLDRIFKHMPGQRQTLMFSATLPPNILSMSDKYMHNPKRVSVGETNVVAKNIEQDVIRIEQNKKYGELTRQLEQREGSVIVFVKTKYAADKMAKNLRHDGFTADALHGDLRQRKRDRVMENFRKMNFRVLIATDIAARGLDVPHIEHVINFDLPQAAEDFIHRMGRTARAGASGSAVSFVSNQDGRKWHAIERLIDPEAAERKRKEKNNKRSDDRRPSGKKSFGKKPFAKRSDAKKSYKKESGKNFDNKSDRSYDRSSDRSEQRSTENSNDNRSFFKDKKRNDRPERQDRNDRTERSERSGRSERQDRNERNNRNERFERSERDYSQDRHGKKPFSDRPKRRDDASAGDKHGQREHNERNERNGQNDRNDRNKKTRYKSDSNTYQRSDSNKGAAKGFGKNTGKNSGKNSGKSFGKNSGKAKSGNYSQNSHKSAQRKKAS